MKSRVLEALVALGATVPQLSRLEASHLQSDHLHFLHGKRMVANPDYAVELATYEAEIARRAAEVDQGLRRKRHAPPVPQAEAAAWDWDGFELSIGFEDVDPGAPRALRAAASSPLPGYEAIRLRTTGWDFEAEVLGVCLDIRMDGADLKRVQKAIFDALLQILTD